MMKNAPLRSVVKPLHKSCQASVIFCRFFWWEKGANWVMIDEEHAFYYSPSIYDDLVPLKKVFQFGKAHKKQGAKVCNFLLSIGSSEVPFNPQYLEPILAW